jgi:hypothetical protein
MIVCLWRIWVDDIYITLQNSDIYVHITTVVMAGKDQMDQASPAM